jgi:hypothetical protein
MSRSPELPAGRFVLPAGTVVYHGSRLEGADDVRASGLRPRKPSGPKGNYRWLGNRDELSPIEAAIAMQPSGVYVGTELREMRPWADAAGGTPCVWKVDASGLTATRDHAYPENPHLMRLVGRRIRPERLIGLYDVTRREWIA